MRCFVLLTLVVGFCALGTPAYSQTPDGLTPANEGICDSLAVDGVTKGLYGLCVAFCEAHDATSLGLPISQETLEDIANSRPSGRILENYNRKKKDSDPEMPCIKVEEPCPCWERVELDNILGQHSGGDSYDADYCWEFDESPWQIYTAIGEYGGNTPFYDIWAIAWEWGSEFAHRDDYCQYGEYVEGQGYLIRTKDVTADELLVCRDQIRERYAAAGVSAAQCVGDL